LSKEAIVNRKQRIRDGDKDMVKPLLHGLSITVAVGGGKLREERRRGFEEQLLHAKSGKSLRS
jgi:hypothetical protein